MSILERSLTPADEGALRAFWRQQPHLHIFAEADLDEHGWESRLLNYWGWYHGDALVGYLTRYGSSMQWHYEDERLAPRMAELIDGWRPTIHFVSGIGPTTQPVLDELTRLRITRSEPSYVNRLDSELFAAYEASTSPVTCRPATVDDIEALTDLHMAADDQWSQLPRNERRRAVYASMRNPDRRLIVAFTPQGDLVATAQSIAEGRQLAVIGSVATHPAWRNNGYGSQVTAFLCRLLLQAGKTPYLFYRIGNSPAAAIYAKLGFEIVDVGSIVELSDDPS